MVYTWAAWLASDTLQHLGMDSTVTLLPLEAAVPSTAGREEGGSRRSHSKGKGPALLDEHGGREGDAVTAGSGAVHKIEECGSGSETRGEKRGEDGVAEDAGNWEGVSGESTWVSQEEVACSCTFVCSLQHPQPETSLSVLAQYDRHRERQRFNAAIHECGICLRELPGTDFLVSPLCSHFFCQPCSKQFARALVADGNLGGLKCPDTTCRAAMPYGVAPVLTLLAPAICPACPCGALCGILCQLSGILCQLCAPVRPCEPIEGQACVSVFSCGEEALGCLLIATS